MSFFYKWWAWLFPQKDWKKILRMAKGGHVIWEVPGKPDAPKVIPWPVQWIPHRDLLETDDEAAQTRGFVFTDVVCVDSGKEAKVGEGVLCARCGVPLHPSEANMIGGFDPPNCRRCHWFVVFATK